MIEDIHAGLVPVTRIGDYSDVTVIDADGRRIPWPQVSHFDDESMRDLMRQVVDRLHTFTVRSNEPDFLERIGPWMDVASRWDEPKLDESFLPHAAAKAGLMTDLTPPRTPDAATPSPHIPTRSRMFCTGFTWSSEEPDGRLWSAGTDLMAPSMESAEVMAEDLNSRLGLDYATWTEFARRVFAASRELDKGHDSGPPGPAD